MRKALWLLALLATTLLAAAAVLLLLPGLKEGFSRSEMPYYAGGAAGFVLLGALWWFASGRRLRHAGPALAILSVPFLAYLALVADLALAYLEGQKFAGSVAIVGYGEKPIVWPGFDGPVGLALTLELSHALPPRGVLFAPELRMAPAPAADGLYDRLLVGSGYAKALDQAEPRVALLKQVLFRIPPKPLAGLADSGRSTLAYELLPGNIDLLLSPAHICLSTATPGLPLCVAGQDFASGCVSRDSYHPEVPDYRQGDALSAVWLFAGGGDMLADISPQLTEALRQYSQMQGAGERWTAMHKRLEPAALAAAGYRLCPPGPDSHSRYRVCYCR